MLHLSKCIFQVLLVLVVACLEMKYITHQLQYIYKDIAIFSLRQLDGDQNKMFHRVLQIKFIIYTTRSLGALRAPTSSWRPFGPLDFILRALRALRPCDPRKVDQHLLFHLVDA